MHWNNPALQADCFDMFWKGLWSKREIWPRTKGRVYQAMVCTIQLESRVPVAKGLFVKDCIYWILRVGLNGHRIVKSQSRLRLTCMSRQVGWLGYVWDDYLGLHIGQTPTHVWGQVWTWALATHDQNTIGWTCPASTYKAPDLASLISIVLTSKNAISKELHTMPERSQIGQNLRAH